MYYNKKFLLIIFYMYPFYDMLVKLFAKYFRIIPKWFLQYNIASYNYQIVLGITQILKNQWMLYMRCNIVTSRTWKQRDKQLWR